MKAGDRIAHLELRSRLGAGGMGEVYLAFDTRLEREVAVKTLRPDPRASVEGRARFLREARMLGKLEHPAICKVHELIEQADADYLVLEYLDGQTLRLVLEHGLSFARVLEIGRDIAEALAVAHEALIVHRDLKPENVMLTRSGAVKVLDFGIARAVDPIAVRGPTGAAATVGKLDPYRTVRIGPEAAPATVTGDALTQAGTILGTIAYMSPEQARGDPVGTASDIYALGVMLEEMVGHVDDRAQVAPRWLQELDSLCAQLRHLEPERRPSAIETLTRIKALIGAPSRERKRQLRRSVLAAGAVLSVSVASVIGWLAIERGQAQQAAERRAESADRLIQFVLGDLRSKLEPMGRLDLLTDIDQRTLAYFADVPLSALEVVELRNLHAALLQQGDRLHASQRATELSATQQYATDVYAELSRRSAATTLDQCRQARLDARASDLLADAMRALQSHQQALEHCNRLLAQRPDDSQVLGLLATAERDLALAAQRDEQYALASRALDQARVHWQLLAKLKPADVAIELELARALWARVGVELASSKASSALAYGEQALQVLEVALLAEPNHASLIYEHGDFSLRHAELLIASGRGDDGQRALLRAEADAKRLLERDAENADYLRLALRIMLTKAESGELAAVQPEVLDRLDELNATLADDAASAPTLARARHLRARIAHGEDRVEIALTWLGEARQQLQALLAAMPSDLAIRADYVAVLITTGQWLRAAGDYRAAQIMDKQALTALEDVEHSSRDWRLQSQRAVLLLEAGRDSEAQALILGLKRDGYDPPKLREACARSGLRCNLTDLAGAP